MVENAENDRTQSVSPASSVDSAPSGGGLPGLKNEAADKTIVVGAFAGAIVVIIGVWMRWESIPMLNGEPVAGRIFTGGKSLAQQWFTTEEGWHRGAYYWHGKASLLSAAAGTVAILAVLSRLFKVCNDRKLWIVTALAGTMVVVLCLTFCFSTGFKSSIYVWLTAAGGVAMTFCGFTARRIHCDRMKTVRQG